MVRCTVPNLVSISARSRRLASPVRTGARLRSELPGTTPPTGGERIQVRVEGGSSVAVRVESGVVRQEPLRSVARLILVVAGRRHPGAVPRRAGDVAEVGRPGGDRLVG